ncbi:transcriptional regulator, MerR family protein [Nocardiopsis terrae]|uniref:DNA-binding transcriptional MerR regulator n=1 Tax=Nocardiopsis terrae TaxID=372655 RepID=A0ABR9HGG5_9ACTN|nr:MerR family transcriptional regulator [Nocardiopsis terrae]MBE1458119.1 DNA-binding transcriptional MerR regulator [Nocardiopsis terrae]GHC82071.1 transcriptional regulator, MerR family protein [Nocardiopsis terrae]
MAWSTQQVAELAGTTVKAVRYYHRIGLLDVPRRAANGYKQYEVPHLVRLLQIRRLSDLGVPLSEVASMERADEQPDEAIRVLDRELEATVNRLNRVREELALILRHRAPAYVPPEFASISGDLSERQRSLLMVFSTVLSEDSVERFRDLISEPDETDEEFEALPPDADDAVIESLAERILPVVLRGREENPWSRAPTVDAPRGAEHAAQTMAEAVVQLYNTAQLRVLKRLNELLTEEAATGDAP